MISNTYLSVLSWPRQRVLIFLLSTVVFFYFPIKIRAQGEEVVKVTTNLVRLNVGVVDRKGQPVTNLSRDDFRISEDDMRQTVLDFEPTAAPFSLVLLLDMSGSTLTFRQVLKQSALRFIDALGPEDRVSVVAFNTKTNRLTKFTSDRSKIAYAIEIADGKGGTDLFSALNYSLQQLASEGRDAKPSLC
jgi:VWFA-related protein